MREENFASCVPSGVDCLGHASGEALGSLENVPLYLLLPNPMDLAAYWRYRFFSIPGPIAEIGGTSLYCSVRLRWKLGARESYTGPGDQVSGKSWGSPKFVSAGRPTGRAKLAAWCKVCLCWVLVETPLSMPTN
jgi:hypothetical protein